MNTPAPLPENEEARLAALARLGVIDTPPEASFDRITTMAARIFKVPVVLITLIERERQWFKSRVGVPLCETGRDVSFCAFAILQPTEVMVVPDATKDPRFANNSLVTNPPSVRFYAGAPLVTADGYAVGSLCLLDTVPREFSAEDCTTLAELAATVVEMLGLRIALNRAETQEATRREAEAALRQSEARFRRMAENTPGMVYQFVLRPDGTFYFPYVSDRCREIYGVTPEAIYADPQVTLRCFDAEDLATFHASVARSAGTLEPWNWEARVHRPDSPMLWVQGISRPARLPNGEILWDGMLLDITDRKVAEQDVYEAARRVQTILSSITDAFFSLDREWRFTYVNDQAEQVLARSRADLLGRRLWDAFPEDPNSRFRREYETAVETGEPANFEEYSIPLATWLSVHAYPSEAGLSIYFQDVTERKNAEREVEIGHNLLRAIIDGTDDAVFIKDRESRYVLMNPAGAGFFNSTPAAIVGCSDEDFFEPAAARRTREHDLVTMESGRSQSYEDAELIAGTPRVFLTTKSPYRDGEGNVLGVIGIARDVSRQRQDAEALRDAKEEAERANLAKSEFLSRMSHELRTPLNAILGFGQLLEIGEMHPKQHDAVSHIMRAGRHLLALIDEVLSISRIEAGRMELSLEPVGVGDIAGECLSLVSRQAADRQLLCEDRCADGACDYHVLADRQRLRQVILNLLSNAVKYNRRGGRVTFSCRDVPPAEGDGRRLVRIEVADTGAGLQPQQIGRLFVPFERLGAERSNTEGTGLGLALSKGLVKAMGGTLGVESTPGEGSTFWVELPWTDSPLAIMQRDDQPHAPGDPLLSQPGCRGTVLYIEDNLSNLQLIECVFERLPGVELLSVQQGTLGLEVAAARQPDLILLDLHLPDIPGWEVLVRLRDNARSADIPVAIISADATPGQISRLRAIGVKDYLTKPIDVRKLLDLLEDHLSTATQCNLAPA